MATSIPCIQGKMGSVEYYLTTMKAGEAVSKIRIAKELPTWDAMSIEERMQREINWTRVEDQIARYLAEDENRFFGALIVAIEKSDGIEFEPLADMPGLPKLYQNAAKSFGLLHLQGGELFFALDGQHRLKGIDTAISGKTHDGELIEGFQPDHSLANEDLSIILIPYEPAKRSRRIFNKVNKYAKQTSKGDNIITSEDDAFAIIARWLMGSDGRTPVLKQEIVNWRSNTLTDTQTMFTTISVLYEAAKTLLDAHEINTQLRPPADKLDTLYEEVKGFWAGLLKDFKLYKQAVDGSPKNLPDLRKQYLALKPVAQMAIVEAFTIANKHGMALDDFVRALNKIPWDIDNELWRNVLTLPGPKVLAGKTPVRLAARLIAHLVGTKLPKEEQSQLLEDFRKALGGSNNTKPLPKPVA
jgi:DNA sulfur modification protein DndB